MTQTDEPNVHIDMEKISRAWRALMAYRGLSAQLFDSQTFSFQQLPISEQSLIPAVPIRLLHAAEAVEHNADIIEKIADLAVQNISFDPSEMAPEQLEQAVSDFPEVVNGMLAIVRDWSSVGEKDRALMYNPIIRILEEALHDALSAGTVEDRDSFSVLVPGASLGRLSWELARLGIRVQGVEYNYLELVMCNFVLNGTATPEDSLHLYPFVHHSGMARSVNEQLKEVIFPDSDPNGFESVDFSMVSGDLLDIYDEENRWDAVATCFCIENSKNIISYVRRIAKILKIGAVWVNHGSLDFRHDDSLTESNIQITKEELDLVIARCGLRIIQREDLKCRPPYVVNGMVWEEQDSYLVVAVKV